MPAAVIGGAISAVGAVGSAVIANKGASNAAKATRDAADQSAQVLRENYDKSAQALAPWQSSGLQANNAIDALLGLGGSQPTAQPTQAMRLQGPRLGIFGIDFPWDQVPQDQLPVELGGMGGILGDRSVGWNGRLNPPGSMSLGGNALTAAALNPQQAQNAAFDNFRNSTGYQFRLGEGMNALNSGFAGAGTIKSGAAMKEALKYGQNFASNEFGNYLNMLNNQASRGMGAASAQAGVSQSLGNNLANIQMQQGDNLANAALAKSQNTANALNSIGMIGANIFGQTNRAMQPALTPFGTTSSILRG